MIIRYLSVVYASWGSEAELDIWIYSEADYSHYTFNFQTVRLCAQT